MAQPGQPPPVLQDDWGPWIAMAAAIDVAALELSREHPPGGLLTDYITWLAVGLAVPSRAFLFAF